MAEIVSLSEIGADQLDGHGAAQTCIACAEDRPHAALAQRRFDLIGTDLLTRSQGRPYTLGDNRPGSIGGLLLGNQRLHLSTHSRVATASLLEERLPVARRAGPSGVRKGRDLAPPLRVHDCKGL